MNIQKEITIDAKLLFQFKEARKGFSLHARAQSTHAITKMYASATWIKIRERREEKIDLVAR